MENDQGGSHIVLSPKKMDEECDTPKKVDEECDTPKKVDEECDTGSHDELPNSVSNLPNSVSNDQKEL